MNTQQQQLSSNGNNNNSNKQNGSTATTTTNNNNNNTSSKQQMSNGIFIRKEIQRFESVHPNIYSVYDLIESIGDYNLQQQIREHIVSIEDSFVNSQEWTLSRSVPDLKLGILGSCESGKSALVHRFLTGAYMDEESPEGGRFKKELIIDQQSYLLLIRDEGGPPEMQFTHWCDAVIVVFSLTSPDSFHTAHHYYQMMSNYRCMSDVPFVLVGTRDRVSDARPRLVDEARALQLADVLKKCAYYETCAMYGVNVERVFHDACHKVVNVRSSLLCAMANISNPSSQSQSQSQSQQQANSPAPVYHDFYLANPHLLNSAALHSTTQQQQQQQMQQQQQSTALFKEPFSMTASAKSNSVKSSANIIQQQQQQQQQPPVTPVDIVITNSNGKELFVSAHVRFIAHVH